MQVMMKVSMALSFESPDEGAFDLTLLKTLTRTNSKITRRDMRPGTIYNVEVEHTF